MTWEELSRDAIRAAKLLRNEGRWRSSVSRSYYAAYAAVTSRLSPADFSRGWKNPSHSSLPDRIDGVSSLSQGSKHALKRTLRILRKLREDADYRPRAVIQEAEAVDALRNASQVLTILGIGESDATSNR